MSNDKTTYTDGQVFGRWTVIRAYTEKDKYALCRCACGLERQVRRAKLSSQESKSCGCLAKELTSDREYVHGYGRSLIYKVWNRMISRCHNEKDPKFKNYGARGISVCPQWRESFETFLSDVGEAPFEGATLDRENNDGDYCPSNVRWATRSTQALNKTTTRYVNYRGERKALVELCRSLGISEKTVKSRLNLGWELEKSLHTAVDSRYLVGGHRGC